MRFPRLFRFRLPAAQVVRLILSTSVIALLGYTTSRATDLYWDSNGATPGGSDTTTATGTWGTSSFWNTDSLGGAGTFTATTLNTDDLRFSAGTTVTGVYTVTVNGAQTANSLTFEEGSVTLSGGSSITLGGGGGGNTGLTFANGTGANTISTALVLASDAAFTNSSASNQIITGGVTGTANLTLNDNSTGSLTLSTGSVNNAGTITNSGTGTGGVSIGVIGSNVTGIIQNSLTSNLTFSAANATFASPVTVKAGTIVMANASGLGTAVITLGDSAGGSKAASLVASVSGTVANQVVLASNTTGPLTIGNSGTTTAATFSGGVTGGNNLIINTGATTGALVFSGAAGINNGGTVTHTGSGTGLTTISSIIGSNVTQVIQNSATSPLTLSNGLNAFGALFVKAGTVQISQNTVGQLSAGGAGTITLGDSTGSANATLQLQGTQATFSNPIVLGSTTGLLTVQLQNTGTSATFSGGITGNNSVTLSAAGTGTGTASLSITTNDVNNVGTITNATVGGTGAVNISAVIGANVTGVIQNSATSRIVLSNSELYNAPTTVLQGILELASGSSLAASAVKVSSGATLLFSSDSFLDAGSSLTVDGGGILSTLNNAATTITINGNNTPASVVNFGVTGSTPAQWNIDVGTTVDSIFLLSDTQHVTIGPAGLTVNVTSIGTIRHSDELLISALGGVTASGPLTVNATTGNFGGYTLGLRAGSDGLYLTETANSAPVGHGRRAQHRVEFFHRRQCEQ